MSDREAGSGEGPLRRWSRLKTEARAKQTDAERADASAESGAASPGLEPADVAAGEQNVAPEDLPDIETLDKDSDFTPFLGAGVPDELRRLALRKLWASDPVLANLDGLNDYDEDFSTVGMIARTVATLFKPGEGMPEPAAEPVLSEPDQPAQANEGLAEASGGPDDGEPGEDQASAPPSAGTDEVVARQTAAATGTQDPDERDDPDAPSA